MTDAAAQPSAWCQYSGRIGDVSGEDDGFAPSDAETDAEDGRIDLDSIRRGNLSKERLAVERSAVPGVAVLRQQDGQSPGALIDSVGTVYAGGENASAVEEQVMRGRP